MGYMKTAVNIFITCIVLIEGMADQCTTGSNIVLPCSNVTTPTNQMFIPVNGSILTDGNSGCRCDVTVVESPVNSIFTDVSVTIINNDISCGFQVMAGRGIIQCYNKSSSSTNIKLNQSLSLTFSRDNTPNPPSTAGFCLQVVTQNATFKVTKVCRTHVITAPSPMTIIPTSTAPNTISSQHTIKTNPSITEAPNATILMTDIVMRSPFTTEAPNATTSVRHSSTTNSSTTKTPQSRKSTVKAMSMTGDFSTASTAHVNNGATVDQLPVAAIGGGIAGGLLLIITIIIVIICICKRRKTNDYDKPSSNREDNPYHTNITTGHATVTHSNGGHNGGKQSSISTHSTTSPWNLNPDNQPSSLPQDMIIMENDMYISAESLLHDRHAQNSNIRTTDIPQPEAEDKPFSLDPNSDGSNMYAVVNKAPKSSNPNRPLIPMAPRGSSSKPNECKANGNDTVQYADIRFNKTTEF